MMRFAAFLLDARGDEVRRGKTGGDGSRFDPADRGKQWEEEPLDKSRDSSSRDAAGLCSIPSWSC